MNVGHTTIPIESELWSRFTEAAAMDCRPAAQVLRELMCAYVCETYKPGRKSTRDTISGIERHRRENAVNFSLASVGLEGFKPSIEVETDAQRFIRGEIDLNDFLLVRLDQQSVPAERCQMSDERERLEADYTFKRIVELELDPVLGNFDVAHLREINFRIFQDLPAAGFEGVTPGEFRQPVPEGKDWMKNRGLCTVKGSFYVAYSRMDQGAQVRLGEALKGCRCDDLRDLSTEEFIARVSKIYSEVDYIHPFSDGNSRTLRTFTRQLASESGYEIDWEWFSRNPDGRDLLYIARDRIVNELAKPHIQHEQTMRKIIVTSHRLASGRDLSSYMHDIVRPQRKH